MTDYSDIIFMMAAMLVFSMLSLSVNRSMTINNAFLTQQEADYHALTIAQEIIDDIRWISSENDLDSYVSQYPETLSYSTDSQSGFSIPFNINVTSESIDISGGSLSSFLVEVTVNSQYMTGGESGKPIKLDYIKSFN